MACAAAQARTVGGDTHMHAHSSTMCVHGCSATVGPLGTQQPGHHCALHPRGAKQLTVMAQVQPAGGQAGAVCLAALTAAALT
jgi:hypothetical protein